jgi:DNA-binding response OmpR family regulator
MERHDARSVPMILLVDADPMIRLMATQMLIVAGFGVTEAAGGEEALVLFDRHEFSLVLLDAGLLGATVSRCAGDCASGRTDSVCPSS